jgi:hypothetical protein
MEHKCVQDFMKLSPREQITQLYEHGKCSQETYDAKIAELDKENEEGRVYGLDADEERYAGIVGREDGKD